MFDEMGVRVFVVKRRKNEVVGFLNSSKEGERRSFLGSTNFTGNVKEMLMRTAVCVLKQFNFYFLLL